MPATDPDALQQINRLAVIARVISATVHDLNNVLQVIGGSAELLALKEQLGPAEQRRVASINTQTGRAAGMLDRLTAFTRADGGRTPQDLAALADTALALREFAINRARIKVSVDRRDPPPCRSLVNRSEILQVLLNVLLNAEAALKDRTDGTIAVMVERGGPGWTLTFADNGPGMSDADRGRLAGADPPAYRADATGIGLWVSKRIAERHGGRLDVDASPSGTTVVLGLPAV